MIYEWIERNRKDIDILTSQGDVEDAKQKAKRVLGYPEKQ